MTTARVLLWMVLGVGALVLGGAAYGFLSGETADAKERAPAPAPAPAPAEAPAPLRLVLAGDGFWIPDDCGRLSWRFDLLVHFHGVPSEIVDAAREARLTAVLSVTNAGVMSNAYREVASAPGWLERRVDAARRVVARHCAGSATELARMALSSFSAGYAAVETLLEAEGGAALDAVLLADSLHAAYAPSQPGVPFGPQLEPFVRFAKAAVRGDKLMVVTHSAVRTPDYASTTETANVLLEALDLEREPVRGRSGETTAHAGAFWLRGLPGADESAHARHLQRIGTLLFPFLAERWR